MQVRVLVAGSYNGPGHHDPVTAEPGAVIEVAGGWYVTGLIARGLVTTDLAGPEASAEAAPAPATEPGPTLKPARGARASSRKAP